MAHGYAGRGLHGQTVEAIAQRILGGEFTESATLDPVALQQEYDVSLTVVREAFRVLGAKGLVDARQKRGTFVTPRSSWHLLDPDVIRWQFAGRTDQAFLDNLAEMRGIVEPAAARLAASRKTEADLAEFTASIEDMENATDEVAAVEADLRFHRALLGATHNELLSRLEVVLVTGLAQRDRIVHGIDHTDNPAPAHAAVVTAIEAGDADAADVAMRDLLDKAVRDLSRVTRRRRARSRTGR
jgi:GntR family galactonate operon transcriptional repressor